MFFRLDFSGPTFFLYQIFWDQKIVGPTFLLDPNFILPLWISYSNRTNQTFDLLAEMDMEFDTTNILILVLGCVVSLLTILGNSIVNMKI